MEKLKQQLTEEETLLSHYRDKTLNARPWGQQLRLVEMYFEQAEVVKEVKQKINSLLK